MKYQTYPNYKPSGVEWLGDVPEHWEIWKLSHAFEQIGSGTTPKSEAIQYYEGGTIAWVNTGDLNDGELFDCEKKVTELALRDCSSLKIFPENSLVIAMYGATIGKLALLRFDATVNQACCVFCESSYIQSKFLFYSFIGVRQHIVSLATGGGQPNISQDILRSLKLSAPNKKEQQKIANFLDHETAKIDTLIDKQQRLIALLKEKRQAVISHAVTKGLNPNAPMKDSGVEWLGDVPVGWRQIPLKLIVQTRKGAAFKADDFCDYGIRVVKASDIKQLSIRASEVFLPEKFIEIYPKAVLTTGDIILSTVGSNPDVVNSAVGQIGSVPNELANSLLNQNTVVYDPDEKKVVREYLFYVLQMRGYRDHLDLHAHGTANQSSLNISDMLDFVISLPPISEQIEIRDFLNLQENKLKLLEQKSIESGLLLQERRTAIISAAVTGKIEVRDWGD